MQIFGFFVGALVLLSVNGFAVVAACGVPRLSYRELLPSPIIGACVLSIAVTMLYRWGVPPYVSTLSCTAISVAIIGTYIFRNGATFCAIKIVTTANAERCLCVVAIAALMLLPHYLGGEKFVIFQGNRHDTINYLSASFGFANYSYAYLSNFDVAAEPAAGLVEAANMLSARPTVALLYASFYKILSRDFLSNAYEYCLVGQMNFYFAFLYLSLRLFPRRERLAHVVSAAFCVGFFGQYILDINAWSELFAVPIMLVLVTDYCRGLLKVSSSLGENDLLQPLKEGGLFSADQNEILLLFVRLPIVAAGMAYFYPEITPVAGLGCAAALVVLIFEDVVRGRYKIALRVFAANALFAFIAAILVSGYWKGTFGFLLQQLQMASGANVKWHYFFQAYLFGGGGEVAERIQSSTGLEYWFYVLLVAPANFVSGIFGLYFLQLRGVWMRPASALYCLWAVALLASFGTIILRIVSLVRSEFGSRNKATESALISLVVAVGLATSIVPIGLLVKGQYWAAGKGLSMISPFIFQWLILPVMIRHTHRTVFVLLSLVIAGHLLFGVYRPIVVASRGDGSHFQYPYPSLSGVYKAGVEWDISRYEKELEKCSLVRVDINEPFLERVVENYLMEQKISWFSPNPQKSYYGGGVDLPTRDAPRGQRQDCAITTNAETDLHSTGVIILDSRLTLRKDRILRAGQLLVIGSGLEGILGQGWSSPEAWGVWSDAIRAQLLLPLKSADFPKGVRIKFLLNSYVPHDREQRLEIRSAERDLASRTFDALHQQQVIQIELNVPYIDPTMATRIEFSLPDAISPSVLGGVDNRQLGVGLISVLVMAQ